MPINHERHIANFLFEVGTMRKLLRMHCQPLLTDDLSDNIATHSYRVAMIGWFLAKREGADPYKTVMMCLLHDIAEARTGDHNWIHKRYVKVFEEEIAAEQLGTLPFMDLKEFFDEYQARETKEALIAKDADNLDQILLLREYEWQGNKEAVIWLHGKKHGEGEMSDTHQLERLKLPSAKDLGRAMYEVSPSEWWENLWTNKNR